VLSEQTGGRAFVGRNDLAEPFAQIARDNGAHYLLGFRPAGAVDASRFRELRVRVKREGARVFARKGYGGLGALEKHSAAARAVARAWEGKSVRDLLDRPLPASSAGLPMRASASVIGRAGAKARVLLVVEANGANIPLESRGNAFVNQLEVGYRAIDARGAVAAGRIDTTRLAVSEKTREAIATEGWRYLTTFDLAPGSYQLRVALREMSAGLAGTVFVDVDVADLRAATVIDGILIGAASARAVPASAPDAALLTRWPLPPTTRRLFTRADTLAAFVRIVSETAATVRWSIVSDDGQELIAASKDVPAAQLAAEAEPLAIQMPLVSVPPARYVMTIGVQPAGAAAPTSTWRIPFEVTASR
jgi:hypothetical protein